MYSQERFEVVKPVLNHQKSNDQEEYMFLTNPDLSEYLMASKEYNETISTQGH